MLPDQRAILHDLFAEAIKASPITREQIDFLLAELEALAGAGIDWVNEYRDDTLRRVGLIKELAEYRRKAPPIEAHTRRGSAVQIPAFASVRVPDSTGRLVAAQIPVEDMSADQLREVRLSRMASRDTLSKGITYLRDLEGFMAEHQIATAGEAIRRMEQERAS